MSSNSTSRKKSFNAVRLFLGEHLNASYESSPSPAAWKNLSEELFSFSLNSVQVAEIMEWCKIQFAQNATPPSLRILHTMEKDLIAPSAYGLLLDALQVGMLKVSSTEILLEQIAMRSDLPITKESMHHQLVRSWFEPFDSTKGING